MSLKLFHQDNYFRNKDFGKQFIYFNNSGKETNIWSELIYYSEATAASKAGLRSALVARDGNEELTEEHFQNFLVIESFGELFGDDDDEDYKRLEGEDNGEVDDEDEDEDDLGEEEEEPEDDEGEDEDDA